MDIVLALLPWRIVWTAAIFRTEKIGALVAMSLGVVYVYPHYMYTLASKMAVRKVANPGPGPG